MKLHGSESFESLEVEYELEAESLCLRTEQALIPKDYALGDVVKTILLVAHGPAVVTGRLADFASENNWQVLRVVKAAANRDFC